MIYQFIVAGIQIEIIIEKENDKFSYLIIWDGGLESSPTDFIFDEELDAVYAAIDVICQDSILDEEREKINKILKRDLKISQILE